jgi:peptidyl-prolyl cis-trans isomerase B (cyclophilin B)
MGVISCGGQDKKLEPFNPEEGPKLPNPVVVMETSEGTVKIELFINEAPRTVKNFLTYVEDKHYDGTIFHRVIPDFMIQGGGFTPEMKEKPARDPIKNESGNGLTNDRGTLAMARTNDPHSASAQFFINVKDNGFLNKAEAQDGWGYAVFGKVTDGMDVVDKIRNVKTETTKEKVPVKKGGKTTFVEVPGHENVPVEPVIIKSIRRVEN